MVPLGTSSSEVLVNQGPLLSLQRKTKFATLRVQIPPRPLWSVQVSDETSSEKELFFTPITSSEPQVGRSNEARWVSDRLKIKNITNTRNKGILDHICFCAMTIRNTYKNRCSQRQLVLTAVSIGATVTMSQIDYESQISLQWRVSQHHFSGAHKGDLNFLRSCISLGV